MKTRVATKPPDPGKTFSMAQRVAVALSGGADSALAAHMLLEEGFDVFALHAVFSRSPHTEGHSNAALAVATLLGIQLHTVDLSREFAYHVIDPFCTEYAEGRTPNPCVRCNAAIKFGALLAEARRLGADLMATGHYARTEDSVEGTRLLRGVDHRADQSYFLYRVGHNALARTVMPLGRMMRADVHTRISGLGLPISRPSADLCFINDRSYHSFVAARVGAQPGPVVDSSRRVLGKHRGLPFYTVGQRHGLKLSLGYPAYVTAIRPEENQLVVGPEHELYAGSAIITDLAWIAGHAPSHRFSSEVRVRYRARAVAADIEVLGTTAHVKFHEPQKAVAPGQSLVVYNGETVLGGGILKAAW